MPKQALQVLKDGEPTTHGQPAPELKAHAHNEALSHEMNWMLSVWDIAPSPFALQVWEESESLFMLKGPADSS